MKIINLQVENIKKLTAIDITPTDNMVLITGPNGAGKSSVLDSIVMALCGSKSIPAVPIKKGSDKGKVILNLGDYTITRSFTKDNSYLKIENSAGSSITSPQKFLDRIVGNISFDPLDFLNNEKLKQRNLLLKLLSVDVDELDKKEKDIRNERIIVGRKVKLLEAQHRNGDYYPEVKTTVEVSLSNLSTKLKKAIEWNALIEHDEAASENLKTAAKQDIGRLEMITSQMEAILKEKKVLEESIRIKKESYTTIRNRLAQETLINTEEIESEIANAESVNQKVRANAGRAETLSRLNRVNFEYDDLTRQIDSIAQERKDLLAGVPMPVLGLSFDNNELLYNSIPLDQCSDSEKLMVSLGISMALNPTLRVLRIKDGSLLDAHNREIIRSMIKEKDYQVWFESVGPDGKIGIYIEEGKIVSVDGKSENQEQDVGKAGPIKEKVRENQKRSGILPTIDKDEEW